MAKKALMANPLTGQPVPMSIQPLVKKKLEDVERAKQKVRQEGKPQKKTADGKVKKSVKAK